jgi:hypothetical protein
VSGKVPAKREASNADQWGVKDCAGYGFSVSSHEPTGGFARLLL